MVRKVSTARNATLRISSPYGRNQDGERVLMPKHYEHVNRQSVDRLTERLERGEIIDD
jgi:hypothetical protein